MRNAQLCVNSRWHSSVLWQLLSLLLLLGVPCHSCSMYCFKRLWYHAAVHVLWCAAAVLTPEFVVTLFASFHDAMFAKAIALMLPQDMITCLPAG
jgi:hypothetical protein